MDDASFHDLPQTAGRFRRFLWALGLWRRSRCLARAAEETYESARHHETQRDVAASHAFKALTGDDRPRLPEVATSIEPDAPPRMAPAAAGSIPTA